MEKIKEQNIENRINIFLEAIMKVARGDYTVQLELSDELNYLDALAMGINMMVDDLNKSRETELENDRINHLNAQLIEAKQKAEESDRLKSAFLANMSHEIRTPMNGILGFAALLKSPNLSGDEQQDYIEIIEKSGVRMLNIINNIVDISKIEANQMETTLSATNINEQIEYVHTFFKPEAQEKGLKLSSYNTLPAHKAQITTDREKLYAVLINLVKNSIKYTNEGEIEFGYVLKENSAPPEIEFYVKDTGIGIHKEKLQHIFERFTQADIENRCAAEGAGLGLSITQAYVNMIGGKIWVVSEPNIGSTFYFTIPYKPLINQDHKPRFNGTNNLKNNINKLKILIVEDNETSELLLSTIVRGISKEILKARNGIDAIEQCRNNSDIDLILMDIRIPIIDGHETVQKIREFNMDVVIIAQTAYGLEDDKAKALKAGCNDYISKPIDKDELLNLIAKYFRNYKSSCVE